MCNNDCNKNKLAMLSFSAHAKICNASDYQRLYMFLRSTPPVFHNHLQPTSHKRVQYVTNEQQFINLWGKK